MSEPEGRYTKLESVCCTMCAGALAKTVMYVCESGHVVCDTCRKTDGRVLELRNSNIKNQNSGPNLKKSEGQGQQRKQAHEIANELYDEDFASGDHNHCSKCFHRRPKSKSVNNKQDKTRQDNTIQDKQASKPDNKKLLCSRKIFSDEEIHFKKKKTMLKHRNRKLSDGECSVPCSGITFNKNFTKSSNYIQREAQVSGDR